MIKFTKEEKTAIIFLLVCLFVGSVALYFKKSTSRSGDMPYFKGRMAEKKEKVNINRAGRKELTKLKRIGPVLAGRIISYREMHGSFRSKDDLKLVKGIGENTYEGIKDHVTLE